MYKEIFKGVVIPVLQDKDGTDEVKREKALQLLENKLAAAERKNKNLCRAFIRLRKATLVGLAALAAVDAAIVVLCLIF